MDNVTGSVHSDQEPPSPQHIHSGATTPIDLTGNATGSADPVVYDGDDLFLVDDDEWSDDGMGNGTPQAYVLLTQQVMEALAAAGLVGSKLAVMAGEESEMLSQALSELGLQASFEARGYVLHAIQSAVDTALSREPLMKRVRGDHLPPNMARTLDAIGYWQSQRTAIESLGTAVGVSVYIPPRGFKRRSGAAYSSTDSRQARDLAALAACQEQLISLNLESDTPSSRAAALTANPRRTLADLIGKLRPSTAAKYLRQWQRFREWSLTVKGVAWPVEVSVLVDYVHVLADEPCSPTQPQVWFQAVAWMYRVGGFVGPESPTNNALLIRAVERLTVSLGANLRVTLQAARFPTAVLAALELYVVGESHPPMKRVHAGSILFRSWGTLRFDDLQRLRRHSLRFVGDCVQTELTSSKTSGPGKRVRQLPICVSEGAELLKVGWLVCWLELLQEYLPLNRDYLLDKPACDFRSTTDQMLRYAQSSALTQTVLLELRVPECGDEGWFESVVQVVPDELVGLFTEHSGRAVVPSLAILVEDDKTKRDMLGRWQPSGSDDYSRTHRAVVAAIQNKVALCLRQGEGATRLHEADIVDRAGRFLRERKGLGAEQASLVCGGWASVLVGFAKRLGEVVTNCGLNPNPIPPFAAAPLTPPSVPAVASLSRASNAVESSAKFLVTYNRDKSAARLHRAQGGCHWASSLLHDSRLFSTVDPSLYNKRCKFCWPELMKKNQAESESSSDDSDE